MKLSCTKNHFETGVNITEKITNRSNILTILNYLLVETVKTGLKLTSTDLEIGIETIIPAKIEKQGKVAIPAKVLNGILHNLFDEKMDIFVKGNQLILKTPRYRASLNTISTEDFPILPRVDKELFLTLDPNSLILSLQQTLPAVASSEIRPEITGIFIRPEKDVLKIVSTDSFRLAEKKIENFHINGDLFSFILPQRTASEIIRIIQLKNSDKAEFHLTKNQMMIDFGFSKITSRLLEGNYPDYEGIIPRKFNYNIIFSIKELIKAIKLVSNFSSKITDVVFSFPSKENLDKKEKANNMIIYTKEVDLGANRIKVPFMGEISDMDIIFNHRYLLDGLNQIQGDNVIMSLNSQDKPVLFSSDKIKDFIYLVMPVKGN